MNVIVQKGPTTSTVSSSRGNPDLNAIFCARRARVRGEIGIKRCLLFVRRSIIPASACLPSAAFVDDGQTSTYGQWSATTNWPPSEAAAINTAGEVVGYSGGPAGTRAFLWTSQRGMQDLGQLTGSTDNRALAINDAGVVVGTCTILGESHAFVWIAQAGMQDLNEQILWAPAVGTSSPELPFMLVAAHAINNKGQIIATANDRVTPCVDGSGACLMTECAPAPKYFLVLTPVLQETPQ